MPQGLAQGLAARAAASRHPRRDRVGDGARRRDGLRHPRARPPARPATPGAPGRRPSRPPRRPAPRARRRRRLGGPQRVEHRVAPRPRHRSDRARRRATRARPSSACVAPALPARARPAGRQRRGAHRPVGEQRGRVVAARLGVVPDGLEAQPARARARGCPAPAPRPPRARGRWPRPSRSCAAAASAAATSAPPERQLARRDDRDDRHHDERRQRPPRAARSCEVALAEDDGAHDEQRRGVQQACSDRPSPRTAHDGCPGTCPSRSARAGT